MNEIEATGSKSTSTSSIALIGISVAIVAIGLLVYKTKPFAETAQIAEPSTSGIAQSKVGSPATGAVAVEGTTTGMASGTSRTVVSDDRSSGGMAQKPGSFNEPKPYQPNVPYTDYRRTVTASDTGIGASTGTTGTLVNK